MKGFHKIILGMTMVIASSAVFAFPECPPINGYALSGHNGDNSNCTYVSNATVKLHLDPRLNRNLCPSNKVLLTDPHYRITGCRHDILASKCKCTVVRNAQ